MVSKVIISSILKGKFFRLALLTIASPIIIFFSHIDLDFNWHNAFVDLQKWDWIKGSILLTVLSHLYSHKVYFDYKTHHHKTEDTALYICVFYMWIFFFIFYPGENPLGYGHNSNMYLLAGIPVLHYFNIKFTVKELCLSANKSVVN